MLGIALSISVIIISWVIIIWSIVEYIRMKRSEKKLMEYTNRQMEVNRKLALLGKYGIIIKEEE